MSFDKRSERLISILIALALRPIPYRIMDAGEEVEIHIEGNKGDDTHFWLGVQSGELNTPVIRLMQGCALPGSDHAVMFLEPEEDLDEFEPDQQLQKALTLCWTASGAEKTAGYIVSSFHAAFKDLDDRARQLVFVQVINLLCKSLNHGQ